jgi:hypothetical protein
MSPQLLALHRLVLAEAQRIEHLGPRYYENGYLRATDAIGEYISQLNIDGYLHVVDCTMASHHFWSLVFDRLHNILLFHMDSNISKNERRQHIVAGVDAFIALYGRPKS